MQAKSIYISRVIGAALAAFLLSQAGATSAATLSTQKAAQPAASINIIFDTDMWADIDDAQALAMLHALQDRHEVNLLAVTISHDDPWCASYVDLVNTFYGYPKIPIGIVHNGIDTNTMAQSLKIPRSKLFPTGNYTQLLSERKRADGSLVYPHRLIDGTMAPEAVALLRKILAAQPDGSVVMIQVGYSTNLARLLDSKPDGMSSLAGRELVRKKVRLLSVMAGGFGETHWEGKKVPKGAPEFNLVMDVSSAQKLFSEWPTPIVASGLEVGYAMPFPASAIERYFLYAQDHPIAEASRIYFRGLGERTLPNWHTADHTSVLYAVRPDEQYFSLSKPGRVTVLGDGSSRFDESEDGTHRYLILSEEQRARTLEAMVMLASQPPVHSGIP